MCQYSGKVLLVVNTASQCGYTPQYKGLEALHGKYAAQGLVVMGFPANDFGGQEPGDAKKIAETCFNFYGVQFPMFNKISVVGTGTHPLYASLAKATGQQAGMELPQVPGRSARRRGGQLCQRRGAAGQAHRRRGGEVAGGALSCRRPD